MHRDKAGNPLTFLGRKGTIRPKAMGIRDKGVWATIKYAMATGRLDLDQEQMPDQSQ